MISRVILRSFSSSDQVVQADSGSFVYLMPGLYPGYDAYTPYMPFSTITVDGQYVGQEVYPPSPVFQSPIPSPEYSVTSLPHGDVVQAPYLWGSSLLFGDGAFENGYVGVLEIPSSKPDFSIPVGSGAQPSKSAKISSSTNLSSDVLSSHNKKLKPFNKVVYISRFLLPSLTESSPQPTFLIFL